MELKQVEFNTISSSFGALSELAGKLHRFVSKLSQPYYAKLACFLAIYEPAPTTLEHLSFCRTRIATRQMTLYVPLRGVWQRAGKHMGKMMPRSSSSVRRARGTSLTKSGSSGSFLNSECLIYSRIYSRKLCRLRPLLEGTASM